MEKGQIIGITADNTITDQWADAIMFAIKSTDPSFVGGDSWTIHVGPRPEPQAGPVPPSPARRPNQIEQQLLTDTHPPQFVDVVTLAGDTDAEWAARQAAHTVALAAHGAAAQRDTDAMDNYEVALEVERQKVDRIAIAGRVPVNVQGAQPGDYIVPAQDAAGIKGIVIAEADITLAQYLKAVGKVINILPDGRAYVMVKSA